MNIRGSRKPCSWLVIVLVDLLNRIYAREPGQSLSEAEPAVLSGDLLLQIVLHAHYAEAAGVFDLTDVTRATMSKIIRRHPHVFGDVVAGTAAEVIRNWEQIKREEKARASEGEASLVEAVPAHLPALLVVHKLLRKAASGGLELMTPFGKVTYLLKAQRPAAEPAAPGFKVRLLDGSRTVDSRDLIGKKILVLRFQASYCAPCARESAGLARVAEEPDRPRGVRARLLVDTPVPATGRRGRAQPEVGDRGRDAPVPFGRSLQLRRLGRAGGGPGGRRLGPGRRTDRVRGSGGSSSERRTART